MKKSSQTYELLFTRKCSAGLIPLWYRAENELFFKSAKLPAPMGGYMFFEYSDGMAKNYFDMSAVKSFCKQAQVKIKKDKSFFLQLELDFWKHHAYIQPYFEGNKKIRSEEEYKSVVSHIMAAWSLQVIPYWFAYLAFPGLPNGIAKRLEKIRLGAETIIQDTEKLAKKYWDKPALKKTQPLIYFENHFFQISLASFLKKTKKKLYTPNIQLSKKTLTGIGAYSGKAHGKVKIVLDAKHIRTMRKGDVLVAPNTTPEYLPAMRKAAAIITNEGGMLCHAAIVSRELKIPCIIGTKIATKVLQDGDMVEVDANKGMVKIIKRKK